MVTFSGRRGSSYSQHLLKWQYFWILIMEPIFISTMKSLLFLANACIITWYYTWNKLWNNTSNSSRDLSNRNTILPIFLCRLKQIPSLTAVPLLECPPKGREAFIHYFIIHLLTTSWQGVLIPTHEMTCVTEQALCHTFPWDGGPGGWKQGVCMIAKAKPSLPHLVLLKKAFWNVSWHNITLRITLNQF